MPNHPANTPQLRPEKRGDRKESGKTMAWRDRGRRKAFPQSTLRHFPIAGFSPPITRGHAPNPSLRRRRQRLLWGKRRKKRPNPSARERHRPADAWPDQGPNGTGARCVWWTEVGSVGGKGKSDALIPMRGDRPSIWACGHAMETR
jgi:hypothetical protein